MVKLMRENKLKILSGIEKVRDIIVHTYGPYGRTLLLGDKNGYQINDDGYKIIKKLSFDDEYENIGLKLVLDIVEKTENEVHDCTTLATLLSTSFIYEIYKKKIDINPNTFINKWNNFISKLIAVLSKQASKDISVDILQSIAKLCAKDENIGDLLGKEIYELGMDGELLIEESDNDETFIVRQEGYVLKDYISNSIEYHNLKVLLVKDNINSLIPFLNLFKESKRKNQPLLILTFNYNNDIYDDIIKLRESGYLIILYKLRGSKNMQQEVIEDVSLITKSPIISISLLHKLTFEELSEISNIKIINNSIIIPINHSIELPNNFSSRRKARILGKYSTLFVGGLSKSQMEEKISRIEDAKNSCFNALKYGYVLGGGKALFNLANILITKDDVEQIIVDTIKVPFLTLLSNSGIPLNDTILLKEDEGIDLLTHKVISLKDNKIFDCVYGIVRALLNASGLVYTIIHLYDAKIIEK